MLIQPIILCGGIGNRLWPLSRSKRPKQFIKPLFNLSLLQKTCLRLSDPIFTTPTILGSINHLSLIRRQMQEIAIKPKNILLEWSRRNTAPASLLGALQAYYNNKNSIVLFLPADHWFENKYSFHNSIKIGLRQAINGKIVTFGITPNAVRDSYGYIKVKATNQIKDNLTPVLFKKELLF